VPFLNNSTLATMRQLLALGAASVAAIWGIANRGAVKDTSQNAQSQLAGAARQARFLARPQAKGFATTVPHGLQKLGFGGRRDGLLYVPSQYRAQNPMPLVLMLHGAGGDARQSMRVMQQLAEERGFLLLAPDSRGRSWDVIVGEYGPDVDFIDQALQQTFRTYNVDAKRLAIAGFSDGASYALSLGITNGDLWSHVMAFSPGFMVPTAQRGTPLVYISHGTKDRVLPIDRCSRQIVPRLRHAGYGVRYHEFKGSHNVPAEIRGEAAGWLVSQSPKRSN
jgi:phospholipase/carboxylesterase